MTLILTVRVTDDGKTCTQPATVKPGPRSSHIDTANEGQLPLLQTHEQTGSTNPVKPSPPRKR